MFWRPDLQALSSPGRWVDWWGFKARRDYCDSLLRPPTERESRLMRFLISSCRAGAYFSEKTAKHHLRTLSDGKSTTCHESALMANYPHLSACTAEIREESKWHTRARNPLALFQTFTLPTATDIRYPLLNYWSHCYKSPCWKCSQ